MLWACAHLPLLPLEAVSRADGSDAPIAVTSTDNRPRVIACSPAARAAGVRSGMAVSAALALLPALAVQPRNAALESQALSGIAGWGMQFTPAISLAPPDAVLLEIGAGLHLFGGAAALVAAIRDGLAALGYGGVVAAAPTPTAALALARAGIEQIVADSAALPDALAPLPLSALGLPAPVLDTLADLGAHDFADLARLPREGLARRFGQSLVDTIARARGELPDPRPPFVAPMRYRARIALPVPVHDAEAVLFGARRLLGEMAGWLLGHGMGALRLRLDLVHEDAPTTALGLDLAAPSRDPAHIAMLLRERLLRARLPDRVEAIALSVVQATTLAGRDLALFPADETGGEEDTGLVERLIARLGEEAVCALRVHPDHRPELAWRETGDAGSDGSVPRARRPLWLLPEPRPLAATAHAPHRPLALTDGPERIESGWWEARDVRRDYFVARTQDGRSLWVYREHEGDGTWYLHGIFA